MAHSHTDLIIKTDDSLIERMENHISPRIVAVICSLVGAYCGNSQVRWEEVVAAASYGVPYDGDPSDLIDPEDEYSASLLFSEYISEWDLDDLIQTMILLGLPLRMGRWSRRRRIIYDLAKCFPATSFADFVFWNFKGIWRKILDLPQTISDRRRALRVVEALVAQRQPLSRGYNDVDFVGFDQHRSMRLQTLAARERLCDRLLCRSVGFGRIVRAMLRTTLACGAASLLLFWGFMVMSFAAILIGAGPEENHFGQYILDTQDQPDVAVGWYLAGGHGPPPMAELSNREVVWMTFVGHLARRVADPCDIPATAAMDGYGNVDIEKANELCALSPYAFSDKTVVFSQSNSGASMDDLTQFWVTFTNFALNHRV
jgi:hypothetical protein